MDGVRELLKINDSQLATLVFMILYWQLLK